MPCEGCLRSEQYERPQHRSARDSTAEVKAAARDMSSIPGQTAAKQYSLMTDEAPVESEDSSALNTSFVEQLNRTILQGAAYLTRRSACHARPWESARGAPRTCASITNAHAPTSARARCRDPEAGKLAGVRDETTYIRGRFLLGD